MSLNLFVTYEYEPYRVPFFGSPFFGHARKVTKQDACRLVKKTAHRKGNTISLISMIPNKFL